MYRDEIIQHTTYPQFTDVVNGAKRSADVTATAAAAAASVCDCWRNRSAVRRYIDNAVDNVQWHGQRGACANTTDRSAVFICADDIIRGLECTFDSNFLAAFAAWRKQIAVENDSTRRAYTSTLFSVPATFHTVYMLLLFSSIKARNVFYISYIWYILCILFVCFFS